MQLRLFMRLSEARRTRQHSRARVQAARKRKKTRHYHHSSPRRKRPDNKHKQKANGNSGTGTEGGRPAKGTRKLLCPAMILPPQKTATCSWGFKNS